MHKLEQIKLEHIKELLQFDNLELIARFIVEGFITGLHKSPYHGFSVEFAEHRLYNIGESTRFIDWKLYARTDKLFVKKFEAETNLRCQIIIDISPSMLFPSQQKNKLLFSLYSASALIYLMRKQRDAVGLTLFSDDIDFHLDAKLNITHIGLIYSKLNSLLDVKNIKKSNRTFIANTLHLIAEKIHKRSLVVIFSDMFEYGNIDALFSALQHLRHNKHEVILFHTFDKNFEKNFEFSNRPYKFIDLETGEIFKLNPNQIRDLYKQKVQEYFDNIKLKSGQYNIDFVEADINNPFDFILMQYLLKRQKLY